jgi:hypothetical protein
MTVAREPEQVLLRAAQEAMGDAGRSLRRRGWPVEMIVDRIPQRDTFAVSLRFELPHIPVPLEALTPATTEGVAS